MDRIHVNMRSDFHKKFVSALASAPVTPYQREIIISRYVAACDDMTTSYRFSAVLFFVLTMLVSVGGIVATALTSLLQWVTIGDGARSAITWAVWGLTLSISCASITLQAFSIYKKYVLGTATLDKLMNEGWSFLAGCGRYTSLEQDKRFGVFCDKVENILTDTTVKLLQSIEAAQQSQQPSQEAKSVRSTHEHQLQLRACLDDGPESDPDDPSVEMIGPK
jgi:Protein of unknown function (DUF4231)